MELEKLMRLRISDDAPFIHAEYTVWLHNKIIEDIKHELWQHRESKKEDSKKYVLCNQIFMFKSLQTITE